MNPRGYHTMPTTNNGLTAASTAPPAPPDDPLTGPMAESHADHLTETTSLALRDSPEAIRDREGLPPGTLILGPTPDAPMRAPTGAWALLIQAVDVATAVEAGGRAVLRLMAGRWLTDQTPPALCDGDLVVRITPSEEECRDNSTEDAHDSKDTNDTDAAVDVELVLARLARWEIFASWSRLGPTWPRVIAPTVAAVMGLYTDLVDLTARHDATRPFTSPLIPVAMNDLTRLLDAGLLTPRDDFLWERDGGRIRHVARVRADGALVLADGRVFATPSAAASTLSGYPRNGWDLFGRVGDATTLGQLRRLHQLRESHCERSPRPNRCRPRALPGGTVLDGG